MVRAVTIKTSAERNELPGAQFSARSASGADFGGQIGEGLQALSQGVADMSGAMENAELLRLQEQRQLRDFTLAADYTQFVADSETGLAEAGQNMEGGAWEFQKNFMLNNDASFEQWATDRGLSETEQAEWRAKHADVRRGLSSRALTAEFTERNRFYETSIRTSVDALRTRVGQDPANYEAAVADRARGRLACRQGRPAPRGPAGSCERLGHDADRAERCGGAACSRRRSPRRRRVRRSDRRGQGRLRLFPHRGSV